MRVPPFGPGSKYERTAGRTANPFSGHQGGRELFAIENNAGVAQAGEEGGLALDRLQGDGPEQSLEPEGERLLRGIAPDLGMGLEEGLQGTAPVEVLDERAHRDPGPGEYRLAPAHFPGPGYDEVEGAHQESPESGVRSPELSPGPFRTPDPGLRTPLVVWSPMTAVLIEACVDSFGAAEAAIAAGAHRLELADFRAPGGVTPARDLVARVVRASPVPVHVLVRARGGDFRYRPEEVAAMAEEIAALKQLGAAGIVLGALTPEGRVDQAATARLAGAARPGAVTFHRAFDSVPDPAGGLETLVELGIERVLTAGSAPDAESGITGLGELVRRSGGRIGVIAGGGIRAFNVARIVRETGVREVHSRGDVAGLVRALAEG